METFEHLVGTNECSINTISSIMQSDSAIQKQWSTLATALAITSDQVKKLRQDLLLDKIFLSDVVYELLESWVTQDGRDAKLTLLIHAVEEKCQATRVGDQLRLRFNLPCRMAETTPYLTWKDLSQGFQNKVRDNFEKLFPDMNSHASKVERLERNVLIHLMTGRRPPTFKETILPKPSYYVNRRLITRRVISSKIFEEEMEDVLLFTGMERHELSKLVKNGMTSSTTEQLRHLVLTVKFMILDQEQHFKKISHMSPHVSIHLLRKRDDGNFIWIKSSRDVNNLLDCLSDSQDELEEETFCEKMGPTRMPVYISDSPGMGKSVLLHKIGRDLKKMYPERLVFLILMPEFINMIKKGRNKNRIQGIEEALYQLTCENKLGKVIMERKFYNDGADLLLPGLDGVILERKENNDVNFGVELLLDGFDEVDSKDIKFAHEILYYINACMESVRLWITSRTHHRQELERNLSVLGFSIRPFYRSDQVRFLTSFWSQDKKLDEKKLKEVAISCLDSLHNSMKSVDRDLTGIPLQCLLIGETFEEEAVANAQLNGTSSPPSVGIEITSMTSLYNNLVMRKIQTYISASGATKLTEKELMYMHAYVSLEHIFPDEISKLPVRNLFEELKLEELLKVGILESSNMSHAPRFIHQTIAEYFVAWLVVERISEYLARFAPGGDNIITTSITSTASHRTAASSFSKYFDYAKRKGR